MAVKDNIEHIAGEWAQALTETYDIQLYKADPRLEPFITSGKATTFPTSNGHGENGVILRFNTANDRSKALRILGQ